MDTDKLTYTILLTLFAMPILFLMAGFCAAAGHGTLIPAIICFPFGMIGTLYGEDRINDTFMYIGLLQFPIYGVLMDIFYKKYN